ncbi:hypothetical protein [Flavivirga spongiicola]|uniref:Lipocalin-like domain-containing protein n=1 Tax=Flavivirga spongiicola TaxID=421621 RepID=A0ABU7XNE2_9FLAO|nr:hypothetical protein [Flavivirga sp. MEBiC05379]MDO5981622.1 hypothetical protein [Flavivirga sp. MEBiC05379]
MKKSNLILLLFSFILLSFSCQKQKEVHTLPLANFNGIWSDCNDDNFDNCYAVFSIIGDSVYMGHYIEFKNQPFFESGKGIVKGDSIIYKVDVIRPIPAWGPEGGKHYLKLSEDKNTLEGIFVTDSGNSGPLVFKRR